MALSNLAGWNEEKTASSCGTACGAADDKQEEKQAACGSACGASDEPAEKPAACGSACGASDEPAEKPAACGAGDKKQPINSNPFPVGGIPPGTYGYSSA